MPRFCCWFCTQGEVNLNTGERVALLIGDIVMDKELLEAVSEAVHRAITSNPNCGDYSTLPNELKKFTRGIARAAIEAYDKHKELAYQMKIQCSEEGGVNRFANAKTGPVKDTCLEPFE